MRILATLFLLCMLWSGAEAAITFDAVNTTDTTFSTSPSVNVTVGGGCTDRAIVAYVAWQTPGGPGSISSMTIGGSPATFIDGVSPGSASINRRIEMWYRAGNSTGSNTVTATMDGEKDFVTISARSYCGVHQTATLGTSATADNNGNNAAATVDVSSATGEWVVDAVMTSSTATTLTVGAGQTQRNNDAVHVGTFLSGSSDETGAATTTMSWTTNTDDYTGIIAVGLRPAPTGGPSIVRRRVITNQ
jgi:hypothetical protein